MVWKLSYLLKIKKI